MAKEVTISEGQNIVDIAVQEYGSVEAIFDVVADNPALSSINDLLPVGDNINIDESKINNIEIVQFFNSKAIKPSTGDLIFKFNFSFLHDASEINIQFDGSGTLDVEFGDGFIQTFNTNENINYIYSLPGEKEVKIRFSNISSITKLVLNGNQIKGFVDLPLFNGLEEALLHDNNLSQSDMQLILSTVDSSSLTDLIISMYENATANQAIVDLVDDLAANNNIVELIWLGLNIVEQ